MLNVLHRCGSSGSGGGVCFPEGVSAGLPCGRGGGDGGMVATWSAATSEQGGCRGKATMLSSPSAAANAAAVLKTGVAVAADPSMVSDVEASSWPPTRKPAAAYSGCSTGGGASGSGQGALSSALLGSSLLLSACVQPGLSALGGSLGFGWENGTCSCVGRGGVFGTVAPLGSPPPTHRKWSSTMAAAARCLSRGVEGVDPTSVDGDESLAWPSNGIGGCVCMRVGVDCISR